MPDRLCIARRHLTIVNPLGLHLRAAGQLVRLGRSFQSAIWVECRGVRASGGSVLDLTCLAAECGTSLAVEAQGPDAEEAVAALAGLILAGFNETEDADRVPGCE